MIFVDDGGGGSVCPCNLIFFFSTASAAAGICLSEMGVCGFFFVFFSWRFGRES